jgi:hypothetical protein
MCTHSSAESDVAIVPKSRALRRMSARLGARTAAV